MIQFYSPLFADKANGHCVYDAGVGLFMAVKNGKDDGKSIVNFEVYSKFNDLTNVGNSSKSCWNETKPDYA